MPFNIYQSVFDKRSGEYLEKKGARYQEHLLQLFVESPEGETLRKEGIDANWTAMMIEMGISYVGVTPPQMSAEDLREILFELIPRKISAPAEEAPDIIREFQLFWQFLQREFHLENAAACLKVLNGRAVVRRLREGMSNPANFGIAKSFVMEGMERGFDITTQEGIQEWMEVYNAERGAATKSPIPSSSLQSADLRQSPTRGKSRRKMEMINRRKRRQEDK